MSKFADITSILTLLALLAGGIWMLAAKHIAIQSDEAVRQALEAALQETLNAKLQRRRQF